VIKSQLSFCSLFANTSWNDSACPYDASLFSRMLLPVRNISFSAAAAVWVCSAASPWGYTSMF
jgi:hypothetical protein